MIQEKLQYESSICQSRDPTTRQNSKAVMPTLLALRWSRFTRTRLSNEFSATTTASARNAPKFCKSSTASSASLDIFSKNLLSTVVYFLPALMRGIQQLCRTRTSGRGWSGGLLPNTNLNVRIQRFALQERSKRTAFHLM
jgi:hypothetical protein